MDKPKGVAHIAWERGLYRPDCDASNMHDKPHNEDDTLDTSGPDRSFSQLVYVGSYVFSSCPREGYSRAGG